MRTTLVLALLVATVACGAYRFPGQSGSGTGTVSGQVSVVPCAPVEPATPTCKSRPFPGIELTFTGGGMSQSTTTGSDGRYSIELPVGTWNVTVNPPMRIISEPTTVTVSEGAAIVVDFIVDSGIRAVQ